MCVVPSEKPSPSQPLLELRKTVLRPARNMDGRPLVVYTMRPCARYNREEVMPDVNPVCYSSDDH